MQLYQIFSLLIVLAALFSFINFKYLKKANAPKSLEEKTITLNEI